MSQQSKQSLLDCFDEDYNQLVELAREIGVDNVDAVLRTFGGQKPHIPMPENFWDGLQRELRDREIRAKFRGDNYAELAIEYHLTERRVRQIIDGNDKNYKRQQPSMNTAKIAAAEYASLVRLASHYQVPVHSVLTVVFREGIKQPAVQQVLNDAFGQQAQLFDFDIHAHEVSRTTQPMTAPSI